MDKVDVAAVEALRGSKEDAQAFEDLSGINAGEFVDLPLEDKLKALAQGLQDAKSKGIELADIQKLLSKGGPEMVELLKQSPEELQKVFDSASVASNQTVEDIEKADETFKSLWNHVKVFGADAIDFLLTAAKGLFWMFETIGAYLSNLPHGFKAAADAANAEMKRQQALKQSYERIATSKPKRREDRKGQKEKDGASDLQTSRTRQKQTQAESRG